MLSSDQLQDGGSSQNTSVGVPGATQANQDYQTAMSYRPASSNPVSTSQPSSDDQSAQATGASFPYSTGGDTGASAGVKAVGNLPSSAFNFAEGIGNAALHPIDTISGVLNAGKGAVEKGIGAVTGKPVQDESTQTFDALAQAMKDRYGSVENAARTATNDPFGFGSDIMGIITGGAGLAGKTAKLAKMVETVGGTSRDILTAPARAAGDQASKILGPIPGKLAAPLTEAISNEHVDPQLVNSASRLNQKAVTLSPDGEVAHPGALPTYNKFYDQASKHVGDVAQNNPIDEYLVPKVSDAISNKVIPMRQAAGETMGSEMARLGDTKVDITPTLADFESSLRERANLSIIKGTKDGEYTIGKNGFPKLTPPAESDGVVRSTTEQSKLDAGDKAFVSNYVTQLNGLGNTPSAANIEAFEARNRAVIQKALDGGTINRNVAAIVKNHASSMLDMLKPDVNPEFAKYAEARKTYAQLSSFLEQGDKKLGDPSVLGNPTRLTSTLKSAIKSIHSTGNKDWLNKLEELTGYPALDETTLASQAMDDAGDVKGKSLLSAFSEKGIPSSPSGLVGKMVKFGLEKTKEKIVGNPSQQTKRVLSGLIGQGKSASTPLETELPIRQQSSQSESLPPKVSQGKEKSSGNAKLLLPFIPPTINRQ